MIGPVGNADPRVVSTTQPKAAPQVVQLDTFKPSERGGPMTPAELRRLAAIQKGATPPSNIDINKIPFGVEIEAEGFDPAAVRPTIAALPEWNVNPKVIGWNVETDASLKSGGEAVSPVMIMEGGEARRQIGEVLRVYKAHGAQFNSRCGLHIHVDASVLGKQGLSRLMRIALENENLLFRISQNGRPHHRGTFPEGMKNGIPYYHAKPLSRLIADPFPLMHAPGSGYFRNAYYGQIPNNDPEHPRPALPPPEVERPFNVNRRDPARYVGINFNSYWYRGTIEFRLFDPTDDVDQIMADVELVLGLIKTAAEDSYVYLKPNPLDIHKPDRPVSQESFNYFLSKVAPRPELSARLAHTFQVSGGQLEADHPVEDPAVLDVALLMSSGYRFQCGGQAVTSPMEVASELRDGRRPVSCTGGDGINRPLDSQNGLEQLACAELVRTQGPEKTAQLRSVLTDLVSHGHTFCEAATSGTNGEVLDATALPRLQNEGQVARALVRSKLITVAPDAPHEGLRLNDVGSLESYARLASAPVSNLKPEARDLIVVADQLKLAGVPIGTVQMKGAQPTFTPVVSRHALLDAMRAGSMVLPLTSDNSGGFFAARSLAELKAAQAIVTNDKSMIPTHLQADVSTLASLEAKGVRWTARSDDGTQEHTLNRLGQLDRLHRGTLLAHLPKPVSAGTGTTDFVSVPSSQHMNSLAAAV